MFASEQETAMPWAPRRVRASTSLGLFGGVFVIWRANLEFDIHVVFCPQFLGRVGGPGLSGLEDIVTQALGDEADNDFLFGFRCGGA